MVILAVPGPGVQSGLDMCLIHTSSTAQGGGGNFKNKKPIGELGCCESWMAERLHCWIDKWLDCRAAHLSIHPCLYSIHPSNCLSVHPSFYPFIFLSFIYLFICLSICLSICLFIYLSISLSLYVSVSLSAHLSVHLSVFLSVLPPVHLTIDASMDLCLYLSIP